MATTADAVRAYQNALGRAPTAGETAAFLASASPETDLALYSAVATGAEARQIAFPALRYFQAAFGRVADQAGLNNAEAFIRAYGFSASTLQQLAEAFATSTEFTNRYGAGSAIDAAFVNALYQNVLGRTGTAAEIQAYVSGSNGYTTRPQVLYAFAQSTEFQNRSTVAAGAFTTAAAQGTATYTGQLVSPTGYQGYTDSPGNDYLRGGDGADTFDLSAGGNDTIVQNPGDSGRYIGIVSGATTVTGAFDIVTGESAGDRLVLTSSGPVGQYNAIAPPVGSLPANTNILNNTFQLVRGRMVSGGSGADTTFTAQASGPDYLMVYDSDTSANIVIEAVVFVGLNRNVAAIVGNTPGTNPSFAADAAAGIDQGVFFRID